MAAKGLVIVTGGSGGIGLATAQRFAAEGWRAVSFARRSAVATGVESLLVDFAAQGWGKAVGEWLEAEAGSASRIVLVHNAAASWHDSVVDAEPLRLASMLDLCLVVPQALNRLLLPRMGEGSAIIYIGSTLSLKAVPNSFSYITAKHATIGMMRATCQDLHGRGIHTACICPGVTDTPMLRSLYGGDVLQQLAKMPSVGRLIQPAEIAAAIHMAATTPVVNGAVIQADYGQVES